MHNENKKRLKNMKKISKRLAHLRGAKQNGLEFKKKNLLYTLKNFMGQ